MPPTRAAESPLQSAVPPPPRDPRPFRLGPLVRLEAWWWTGPLGHLVAGTSDLVPLFARYWLHVARRRAAVRLSALTRREASRRHDG